MGKIIVARHGHTQMNGDLLTNVGQCIRGWMDVPLDPMGCEQAIAVADAVRDLYHIRAVYTSDIPRARQSAEVLATRLGIGVIPLRGLRTWHLGDLTGQPVDAVLSELEDLEANPTKRARGGSSYNEWFDNLRVCMRELMHDMRRSKHDVLVMTHGRVISAMPQVISNARNPQPFKGVNRTGVIYQLHKVNQHWHMTDVRDA